jgi:hypothetical protein
MIVFSREAFKAAWFLAAVPSIECLKFVGKNISADAGHGSDFFHADAEGLEGIVQVEQLHILVFAKGLLQRGHRLVAFLGF